MPPSIDKKSQIFEALPAEIRIKLEELARLHKIDPARLLFFLKKWQEENIASFSQEGDMLIFKKGNLPATIPKKEEEKKVVLIKEEEREEKKIPLIFEKPEKRKEVTLRPVPPPPSSVQVKKKEPEPEPSRTSPTIPPPLPPLQEKREKRKWTWEGRLTSLFLYALAIFTISLSLAIDVWFGNEICMIPEAKPLCWGIGGAIGMGKFVLLSVSVSSFARGAYFRSLGALTVWIFCICLGLIGVLGFIATNQEHFTQKNKVVAEDQDVTRATIEELTKQIKLLAEERARAKTIRARSDFMKQIDEKTKERRKLSNELRGETEHVSSENPALKFVMEFINWTTRSFWGVDLGDVSFLRAFFIAFALEFLAPICLLGAPLYWWEVEKKPSLYRRWREGRKTKKVLA